MSTFSSRMRNVRSMLDSLADRHGYPQYREQPSILSRSRSRSRSGGSIRSGTINRWLAANPSQPPPSYTMVNPAPPYSPMHPPSMNEFHLNARMGGLSIGSRMEEDIFPSHSTMDYEMTPQQILKIESLVHELFQAKNLKKSKFGSGRGRKGVGGQAGRGRGSINSAAAEAYGLFKKVVPSIFQEEVTNENWGGNEDINLAYDKGIEIFPTRQSIAQHSLKSGKGRKDEKRGGGVGGYYPPSKQQINLHTGSGGGVGGIESGGMGPGSGGAITNPENFNFSKDLLAKLPEGMRPPEGAGRILARYTGNEPKKISEIGEKTIVAKNESWGEWSIRKCIEFAKWLLQLTIDSIDTALPYIDELFGLPPGTGVAIKIVFDLLKAFGPSIARIGYYTFEDVMWDHGESFWHYVAKLFGQFLLNCGLFMLNVAVRPVIGNTLIVPGSMISKDDWGKIMAGSEAVNVYLKNSAGPFYDWIVKSWSWIGKGVVIGKDVVDTLKPLFEGKGINKDFTNASANLLKDVFDAVKT